jgi:hypothetical protein
MPHLGRTIKISRSEFEKEHRKLVKVLKFGTLRQRLEEARRQAREMERELGRR